MSQSIGGVSALTLTWFPAPVSSTATTSSTSSGFTTSSGNVSSTSSSAAPAASPLDPTSAFQQLASDLQSLLLQLQSQDGTADPSAASTSTATPTQTDGAESGDNATPPVRHHGHHHHAAPASGDASTATSTNGVEAAAQTFVQDFMKAIRSYTGTADNPANTATLVAAA
jgi:hypothetical protein